MCGWSPVALGGKGLEAGVSGAVNVLAKGNVPWSDPEYNSVSAALKRSERKAEQDRSLREMMGDQTTLLKVET